MILIITIYNADSQSKHGVSICKISAVGTYLHHHTSSLDRDVWRNEMTASPQGHCEGLGASSNGRLSHEKVMKMLHLSLTWRKSYNNVWELTMAVFQRLRVVYCRFVNRHDIYLFALFCIFIWMLVLLLGYCSELIKTNRFNLFSLFKLIYRLLQVL